MKRIEEAIKLYDKQQRKDSKVLLVVVSITLVAFMGAIIMGSIALGKWFGLLVLLLTR